MPAVKEFNRYIASLCERLGHADRHAGLSGYCTGLMLPLSRKSVEPMAARLDPLHVSARHQALHHFVARSEWSDRAVLGAVRDWVQPVLGLEHGCYWLVDDTGFPKKGRHSVGVARQSCGPLNKQGKQDNCQVAVSLSLASARGSLPVAYQLYLPQDWADDGARRAAAGVPEDLAFATQPAIALAQLSQAMHEGGPPGVVLADMSYGDETVFRDGITALGLPYAVGIRPGTTVWAPGTAPLAPKAWSGGGARPVRQRRAPGHEPVAVKALALSLDESHWHAVQWREGNQGEPLSGRFAALRVRPAHRDAPLREIRPPEWLLIEWPAGQPEPVKYFLSTAPHDATLEQMVFVTKMRWRIERDHQALKQDFGLSHYEGRGWRGFHHHATLSIAAYAFLMAQRLQLSQRDTAPQSHSDEGPEGKKISQRPALALPADHVPRGRPARPAPRSRPDPDTAPLPECIVDPNPGTLPALRPDESEINVVTE